MTPSAPGTNSNRAQGGFFKTSQHEVVCFCFGKQIMYHQVLQKQESNIQTLNYTPFVRQDDICLTNGVLYDAKQTIYAEVKRYVVETV